MTNDTARSMGFVGVRSPGYWYRSCYMVGNWYGLDDARRRRLTDGLRLGSDMLLKQCIALFILGFLTDLIQTIHIQACSDRHLALSVSTVIALYLMGFLGCKWFVESESSTGRWWLTVASALGAGLGNALILCVGV